MAARFKITRQDKKRTKSVQKTSSDITMCKGGRCPFKTMCHRYTSTPLEHQLYFTKPPFKINKGKPECTMFWGEAANQLFVMMTEIMVAEKKKK